eukprot:6744961-Prymnesium_polylepis.2
MPCDANFSFARARVAAVFACGLMKTKAELRGTAGLPNCGASQPRALAKLPIDMGAGLLAC